MEELNSTQLYGLLVGTLALNGPAVLTAQHLNESANLALFFDTQPGSNTVTLFVGEYQEEDSE